MIGLGIAFVKAVLIALFFMHLVKASVSLRIVIVVTAAFIALLTLGMVADVALR